MQPRSKRAHVNPFDKVANAARSVKGKECARAVSAPPSGSQAADMREVNSIIGVHISSPTPVTVHEHGLGESSAEQLAPAEAAANASLAADTSARHSQA